MKNRKHVQRLLALVLALALLLPCGMQAHAEVGFMPCSSDYIDSVTGYGTAIGSGDIKYTITVKGTGVMTQIGALQVEVYESLAETGERWYWAKTYTYSDYPQLMGSNCKNYTFTFTHSGTEGRYYRAYVTGYAKNSSGDDTVKYWVPMIQST